MSLLPVINTDFDGLTGFESRLALLQTDLHDCHGNPEITVGLTVPHGKTLIIYLKLMMFLIRLLLLIVCSPQASIASSLPVKRADVRAVTELAVKKVFYSHSKERTRKQNVQLVLGLNLVF